MLALGATEVPAISSARWVRLNCAAAIAYCSPDARCQLWPFQAVDQKASTPAAKKCFC